MSAENISELRQLLLLFLSLLLVRSLFMYITTGLLSLFMKRLLKLQMANKPFKNIHNSKLFYKENFS